MNKVLITFIIFLISISLFSQKSVKIKGKKETIYPFEINNNKLYFDWIKDNPNFDSIIVYGMGEATHGTKEFFDIKVKSFQYLVTHKNYRIFGIEASYGECNYINDYIQTGVGNIDTVMQYFSFWTWSTEEVKNLILWMQKYNQENDKKVIFYGFDMQDAYIPLKYLSDFLKPENSLSTKELNEIIKPIITKSKREIWSITNKKNSAFKDTMSIIENKLENWFVKYKNDLIKKHSEYKYKQLKYNLITYIQANKLNYKDYNYRDSCMAENVIEIQKLENAKMFIWAHNGHINKSSEYTTIRMGEYLYEKFQRKYYSVGFVFSKGSFQSYTRKKINIGSKFKVTTLPIYKKNTFTNELDKLNENIFFIDIQNSINRFFIHDLRTYFIGAVFIKKKWSSLKINPKKQYDGIIYLNNTSRAVPIKSIIDKLNK